MIKIAHRVNTIVGLKDIPKSLGIEIDIRDRQDELILHHDPFSSGDNFEEWLGYYRHSLLILNVKTEGLVPRILDLMRKFSIKDYFFLDLSLPSLIKHMHEGLTQLAVRFSEYEPLEQVLLFRGRIDWLWIDSFHGPSLDQRSYSILADYFKLCLVSPELLGRSKDEIPSFKKAYVDFKFDAICTKFPNLW